MASQRRSYTLLHYILFSILLTGPVAPALAGEAGPAVGDPAPEIGEHRWLQKHPTLPTAIAQLRGHVVLVHTFACGCDP